MILAEQHVANTIPARKKLQYSSNTAVDAGPALYTAPVISIRLIQATQRTGDRTLRSWGKAMLTNVRRAVQVYCSKSVCEKVPSENYFFR